jgi:hypothetical protein
MKLFGYAHLTKVSLFELYEVTVAANPALLRELSVFLAECADSIEKRGGKFGHAHFTPTDDEAVKHGPSFVVFNEDAI